jgi:N-acetylglutamate synthase-like GNAT family acetyltransferase
MITIVPFASEHQSGVLELILPIQQIEFGVPITLADQPDLLDIANVYQRGSGNFWVALHGDEVIGSIALIDIGDGQTALRKMFVKAPWRGAPHHVAVRLLDAAVTWCAAQDVQEIYLGTVERLHAAQRFYSKQGFTEIDSTMLPPRFPRMQVDTRFFKYVVAAATRHSAYA